MRPKKASFTLSGHLTSSACTWRSTWTHLQKCDLAMSWTYQGQGAAWGLSQAHALNPAQIINILDTSGFFVPLGAFQDAEVLESHYCLRKALRHLWVSAPLNLLFNFWSLGADLEGGGGRGPNCFGLEKYIFHQLFLSLVKVKAEK